MRSGSTEFFNISNSVLDVLRLVCSGEIHRREIEDRLKLTEKQCVRAIDKLRKAGLIKLVPARDMGRGGKGARLYRCHATAAGDSLLSVCNSIDRHRQRMSSKQSKTIKAE